MLSPPVCDQYAFSAAVSRLPDLTPHTGRPYRLVVPLCLQALVSSVGLSPYAEALLLLLGNQQPPWGHSHLRVCSSPSSVLSVIPYPHAFFAQPHLTAVELSFQEGQDYICVNSVLEYWLIKIEMFLNQKTFQAVCLFAQDPQTPFLYLVIIGIVFAVHLKNQFFAYLPPFAFLLVSHELLDIVSYIVDSLCNYNYAVDLFFSKRPYHFQ